MTESRHPHDTAFDRASRTPSRGERNSLALMILVSLAKRLREAKCEKRQRLHAEGNSPRYYEASAAELALHNAFEIAKRIYRGDDDCEEEFPLVVANPKIRMQR